MAMGMALCPLWNKPMAWRLLITSSPQFVKYLDLPKFTHKFYAFVNTPFDSPKRSHPKIHKNAKLTIFTTFEFNM